MPPPAPAPTSDTRDITEPEVPSPLANTEGRASQSTIESNELQWLYSERLPQDAKLLRSLVEIYFGRTHHLRCLGFIHKPRFMQSLDHGNVAEDYGEPLLYIICASAARCLYLDTPSRFSHEVLPGSSWATTAREMAMKDMMTPSVQNLMSLVLICEYGAGVNDNAMSFLLLGCCYRLIRLLDLDNVNISSDLAVDATAEECCRRLVWSCFILDSICGSGVDANLMWRELPTSIPLPISDRDFLSQKPRELINHSTFETFQTTGLDRSSDVRCHIIYLISLRTRILNDQANISGPQSPFIGLIEQLERWYANLHHDLEMTELNSYIHAETNTLGSLIFLHLAYHAAVFDLTRISLPGFNFPLAASFEAAPVSFRQQCQRRCRFHADEVSNLIRIGLKHGPRALDDPYTFMAIYEATKIQIIHHTTVDGNDAHDRSRTEDNIRANLNAMKLKGQGGSTYMRSLLSLLSRFGFEQIASECDFGQTLTALDQDTTELSGPADSNYLNIVSNLRMARDEVRRNRPASSPSATRFSDESYHSDRRYLQMQPKPHVPRIEAVAPEQGFDMGLSSIQYHGMSTGGSIHGSGYAVGHPAPLSPGFPVTDVTMMPPTNDYTQLAQDMSNYLIWNANEFTSWPDMPDI